MESLPFWPDQATFVRLLSQARAGCPQALGELLEGFRRYLLGIGCADIPSDLRAKADAAGFVQDTFVAAQRGLAGFGGTTPVMFAAWLKSIYQRQKRDFVRSHRGRGRTPRPRELPLVSEDARARAMPARVRTPSSEVALSEKERLIQDALRELPERLRYVVELRAARRLDWAQIGAALRCTDDAARQLYTRALKKLGDSLKPLAPAAE